ncbi:MAG: histidine phosphatase family protein [Deltaproteobacteria bacterium]|nr:histidine phosphatase family protein [Deltaproteobacteria bacterium]
MKRNRLYIVMVGLPARGKSIIASRLKENLRKDFIKARVYNNGDLRRKMIPSNSFRAGFYDPDNRDAVAIREKIALINMERAQRYLSDKGNVAILDATNSSLIRRARIKKRLSDHPVLFIECINNVKEILEDSIQRKIEAPEFAGLDSSEAVQVFKERIAYYTLTYKRLARERNFIRMDSLNNRIIQEEIGEDIPYYDRIRDFLVTETLKNLYLIRHGETCFNLEDRIGGDSELTEKGRLQAKALAEYFRNKDIPLIFTSQKVRTIQTAEPIKEFQENSRIIPLKEFDEIDSGICECMSYREIRREMPHVYNVRRKDKYNYIYPEGEGYVSMKERIDRGIKKALYLSNYATDIMIIGHRAANRMILSHFLFRREEDVPYIYIPQDKFYHISSSQHKKLFQLKKFQ